jgi:hypothetical protein
MGFRIEKMKKKTNVSKRITIISNPLGTGKSYFHAWLLGILNDKKKKRV